jgi:hypothetical protein
MELTLASDITTEKVATSPGLAQLLDYLRRAKVAHRDEIATRVIGILHTRSLRMHRKVVSSSNPLLFAINPSTHKFSAWAIGRHDAPGSWCFHTSEGLRAVGVLFAHDSLLYIMPRQVAALRVSLRACATGLLRETRNIRSRTLVDYPPE